MKRVIIIHVAFLAVLLVMVVLGACTKRSKQKSIVEEWVGKELIIPDGLTFQIQDIPINYDFNNADFKIVTYIDSTGCTNCKMKLHEWKKFINSVSGNPDLDVNFLMIVNSSHKKAVINLLKEFNFNLPVAIDTANRVNALNHFPNEFIYHTFLMDRDNNVIALGNPVINPKIRMLYHKFISESGCYYGNAYTNNRIVRCVNGSRSIGVLQTNGLHKEVFRIENMGKRDVSIQQIVTSCDCVKATINKETLQSNTYADVNVLIETDTLIGPINRYVDVYFHELDNPVHLSLRGYVK